MAIAHMQETARVLEGYSFEEVRGRNLLRREPIGVAGLITAWNWPLNLIISKLSAALAAGCTVVVKPSENAPLSPILLAEIIEQAGLPAGVFNLVNGDGPTVGEAISSHPGRRHGLLYRFYACRVADRQIGRGYDQARGAGAGRQVGEHHPAERQPGQGDR